jgi:hypothetical protein
MTYSGSMYPRKNLKGSEKKKKKQNAKKVDPMIHHGVDSLTSTRQLGVP